MRPHSPRHPHDTPAVIVDQIFRSSGIELDWRAIAIKRTILEALHSLTSLLPDLVVLDDRGDAVEVSRSELRLLQMIPPLLSESVRISHRELITAAVQGLSLGQPINLHPLLKAAIADLQQLQSWQPQISGEDD